MAREARAAPAGRNSGPGPPRLTFAAGPLTFLPAVPTLILTVTSDGADDLRLRLGFAGTGSCGSRPSVSDAFVRLARESRPRFCRELWRAGVLKREQPPGGSLKRRLPDLSRSLWLGRSGDGPRSPLPQQVAPGSRARPHPSRSTAEENRIVGPAPTRSASGMVPCRWAVGRPVRDDGKRDSSG